MSTSFFVFVFLSLNSLSFSSDSLTRGSSLSVENKNHVLISPEGTFSAGFFSVGLNAYWFAVWYHDPYCDHTNCTVVWMANPDQPVNGRQSKLSLLKSGDLVLLDADRVVVWSTTSVSRAPSSVYLQIQDDGNLVLYGREHGIARRIWQSFDFPTTTLLPEQQLEKGRQLVSSRSQSNFSSGFFKLYFDNDNVLRLLYDGPDTSSIYWPDPELMSWEAGRSSYNNSRIAVLDSLGRFSSSDNFTFNSSDYGVRNIQRRLTLDFDGNLRLYSRKDWRDGWEVSWQAMGQPCRIHGACGPNSVCSYVPAFGRQCSCVPGFKVKDFSDWSLGCVPEFEVPCASSNQTDFLQLTHVEFFGYDFGFFRNTTLDECKKICLENCYCKGFQFKFIKHNYLSNLPYCYPKTLLLNGHHSPNFQGDLYLKVPRIGLPSFTAQDSQKLQFGCDAKAIKVLDRTYSKHHENGPVKFVLWFASVVGGVEFLGIFFFWCFLMRWHQNSDTERQGYISISTGFRRFTLNELKKATRNFSEEIGRGAGGIVYKGILSDNRIAAIKKLNNETNLGEAEFQAEVSTIGKLNHMNLIEMWGYCVQGKHRLLVYQHMERGSLADNLNSYELDCEQRYKVATGVAKGLAYLHEECLEWVLHCDVKPQNILLDNNYQPKVSDFGLSHPVNRDGKGTSDFSRIRGTRGYIAPEWVYNLPITSKVDVYSYGVVLLEMVTGKSPKENIEYGRIVSWIRENMKEDNDDSKSKCWVERIIEPRLLEGKNGCEMSKMELLIEVALKCVEEDRGARPTMSQVVEMLLHNQSQ